MKKKCRKKYFKRSMKRLVTFKIIFHISRYNAFICTFITQCESSRWRKRIPGIFEPPRFTLLAQTEKEVKLNIAALMSPVGPGNVCFYVWWHFLVKIKSKPLDSNFGQTARWRPRWLGRASCQKNISRWEQYGRHCKTFIMSVVKLRFRSPDYNSH